MENAHEYIVGKSGQGKTTLLLNKIFDELQNRDRAIFFIDPHGEAAVQLLDALPRSAFKRTCYIDCSDTDYAVGFNPLLDPRHCLSGLKSIWAESWGPRMEWLLLNGLLTLHANPGSTFKDLPKIYYDRAFRERLVANNTVDLQRFWRREYPEKYEKSKDNPDSPILNKIGQINASAISRILCQRSPKLDFAEALRERYIVVVNLHTPSIGNEAAAILGALFTSTLRAVLLRAPSPSTLYADEFQKYGTSMYTEMLSEIRKFGLKMVLAHQFISQIDLRLQAAILGNVAHKTIFNVDYDDAAILSKGYNQITQDFNPAAITELEPYEAFVDGSVVSLPRFMPPFGTGKLNDVTRTSRLRFARQL